MIAFPFCDYLSKVETNKLFRVNPIKTVVQEPGVVGSLNTDIKRGLYISGQGKKWLPPYKAVTKVVDQVVDLSPASIAEAIGSPGNQDLS